LKTADVIQLSKNPVKLIIWVLIIVSLFWVVAHIITTVLIFSLAALFAYLVSPVVQGLSKIKLPGTKRRIPWTVATFMVYSVILGLLILLTITLIPLVISQSSSLASSMPTYLRTVEDHLARLQTWYNDLKVSPSMEQNLKKYGQFLLDKASPVISVLAANLASGVLKVFTALLIVLAALIFSLYIILDEKNIKKNFFEMFPKAWRQDTEQLFHNVGQVVGVFIRGQLILGFLVATGTYCALLLINLVGVHYDYSLLTALAAGFLYPIPFIGVWAPRLVAPILAYAQTGSGYATFWVLFAVTAWGLVADNIFLPVVMGRSIGISPLMILFVMFSGGELFGIWGLVLSIPMAAVIRLVFFYLQEHITI